LIGTDILLEQIPAYRELFGYGANTLDELRRLEIRNDEV
jgi:hypothetical protein